MMKLSVFVLLAAAFAAQAQAPGSVQPTVVMAKVQQVGMSAGESRRVELDFRVPANFHINSNKPHSNLLIPTSLKLLAPKPLEIASIEYPAGEDQTFPFSPNEKLSVYSGDFIIYVTVKAPPYLHGASFPIGGDLYYQACDKNACYPPKKLAVDFNVSVR